jgi:gamma-glutamylcyclotransferase (GGCT)/AIG2-like uncharacterized protein YtfP
MADHAAGGEGQAGTDSTLLFVYGTLMPGHCRWGYVEPFVRGRRAATVAGRLYDTGWDYPAARFDAEGRIEGWVLDLHPDRLAGALAVLDEVEGDEYDRRHVTTDDGATAWTYEWRGPTDALAPLGARWEGA